MKASEYKEYNGLRKESLRDKMTDIEVAHSCGQVANEERKSYEKATNKLVISSENILDYQ